MKLTDWNTIADAYFEMDDPQERSVLAFIREKLATLQPKRLLDYGGGDGKFAVLCAESLPAAKSFTTRFHSKAETRGLRFYHLVRNVTGTVACHPWLGADFHWPSVFIAAWSKYAFPVDVTIWMFVTFPCGLNVNRKRPVPACPGRDWPGGNDGAGA